MSQTCMYTDIIWTLLIGLPFLLITWYVNKQLKSFKDLPAGPWGLPLVGYTVFLGKKPHLTLTKLRKKYGDIYSVNFGNESVIVLSSYKVMKEAFVDQADNFYTRYLGKKRTLFSFAKLVELQSGGEKFVSSICNNADLLRKVEAEVIDEVNCLVGSYEEQKSVADLLQMSVVNVIYGVLTASRFGDTAGTFILLDLLIEIGKSDKLPSWRTVLPTCMQKIVNKDDRNCSSELAEFVSEVVDNCEKEYKPENEFSICKMWLEEIEKQGINVPDYLNKQILTKFVNVLFTDTTRIIKTILLSFLYMSKYPEIQKKVQKEITTIIGNRLPSMNDQELMPYTEATLSELLRLHPFLPLGLRCSSTKNTTVSRKFFPREITVLPNLWAVHQDPNIFPDPSVFEPERFLNNKQEFIKVNELIPFSLGKVKYVGEPVVRMILFLYFTSMLQNFTFEKKPGVNLNVDDFNLLFETKKFKLCAIKR